MRCAARAISERADVFVPAETGARFKLESAARSSDVTDAAGAAPANASATTAAATRTRPLMPVTAAVLRRRVGKWLARALLPFVEQPLDVPPLCLAEGRIRDDAARFTRIVVRDRGFEPLAQRRRL